MLIGCTALAAHATDGFLWLVYERARGACPGFGGTVRVHIQCCSTRLRGARGQRRLNGQILRSPCRRRCRVRLIARLLQGLRLHLLLHLLHASLMQSLLLLHLLLVHFLHLLHLRLHRVNAGRRVVWRESDSSAAESSCRLLRCGRGIANGPGSGSWRRYQTLGHILRCASRRD